MGAYQKKGTKVNASVAILDEKALMEKASEGLLALSIRLGTEVVRQLLERDVTELAGERGKHNPNRQAYRHGTEQTSVVLGGEKLQIQKPRVRSKDGKELVLPVLVLFQEEDPLNQVVLSHLLAGVSTRKYERTLETQSAKRKCASKSEVSHRFSAGLEEMMKEFFERRITGDYVAIMIDGLGVEKTTTVLAAMGIDSKGDKHMLGLAYGGSENQHVVKALLQNLIERGLAPNIPRLFVLDGAKALHKAVKDTFGDFAVIQRCQVHKKRNVLAHLPKSEMEHVGLAMSKAYLEHDYDTAKSALEKLARELESRYPHAAASLREGLDESLTVHKLGLPGLLRQTLSNTNTIESANSVCKSSVRHVRNWRQDGMILRYLAAGFLEAEKGFRRIKGYKELPILLSALADMTGAQPQNSEHASA